MKKVRDFRFKQFTIAQEYATHKVGTDGVLLGAWVNVSGKKSILDIGTGSGLIALMLAQRSTADTFIDAVELQPEDARQARINVSNSPWKEKLRIYESSIQDFQADNKYDLIVSNPPFFINSTLSPAANRTKVRHTETMSFHDLLSASKKLINASGTLAVILPTVEAGRFTALAKSFGFFPARECSFKSRPNKPVERLMLEFTTTNPETVKETLCLYNDDSSEEWSNDYKTLTREFYLKI